MSKKELKAIGFTDYQASEMIRIIKRQLAKANLLLYSNQRIGFVPVVEVENYLLGVSGTIAESDNAVAEIKGRLIALPELKSSLGSEHIAKQVIREAHWCM